MSTSRWFWLVVGVVFGLALGVSVSGVLPPEAVHASATHGQESFAICTGPVDQDVEAVFFLDFVTGDLRAAVLSIASRKFVALYEYNVLEDFPAGTKNPKFLVVTGVANLRRGNPPLGQTVVYVAESISGQVNAYGVPWLPTGRQPVVNPIKSRLVPLDTMKFRTATVRDAE